MPNGELLYLGRDDRQIKLRGYRIEPAEIEAQLMQHPQVRQSVLLPYANEQGEVQLVACVVLRQTTQTGNVSEDLRDFLGQHLPAHMLPHTIVLLDEMPQTTNGKVDHAALLARLPAMRQQEQHSLNKPQTPLENRLGEIWCDVLQRKETGRDQNFFSLGGHSLHALRIAARIEQQLSVRISLAEFLRHQTIAQLAGFLASRATAENPVRSGTIKRVVRGV
ncbi:phosphopantetheine-binding protein [Xenorhabdus szentirmaii]|uniref:phosphopantetheine-binding protein n=1 Tax=Xenorhabdus szentirmaii TaxID=290112 RepID=UPI000C057152|nr:phosphopantetheine-binding protein [Xenorhabdus szentirmaii]PHM40691.1 Amino acid adenylation [Xenorhabdus szentirmaii]